MKKVERMGILGPTPAERTVQIATLCKEGKADYRTVAKDLQMSLSHVRNFERLARRLTEDSFNYFTCLAYRAKIRDWLLLCKLEGAEQERAAKRLYEEAAGD